MFNSIIKGYYNLITFCISIKAYPKLSNSSGEGYSFITSLSGKCKCIFNNPPIKIAIG